MQTATSAPAISPILTTMDSSISPTARRNCLRRPAANSSPRSRSKARLKNSVMVAQCAVVGDKHKFISALISPNFAALESWATHAGLVAVGREALVSDSRVIALYSEIVRETNGGLANFETIKRFKVVADEWTQDSGELTPSMKLKRRVISAKYGGNRRTLRGRSNLTRRIGEPQRPIPLRKPFPLLHINFRPRKNGRPMRQPPGFRRTG